MNATESHQKISDCGRMLASSIIQTLTENGSIHPPTLISATARMSGHYLFKSFRIDTSSLIPGEPILSSQSSEKTPLLISTCLNILAALGKAIPSKAPNLNLDEMVKPRIDFLQTQALLTPVFNDCQGKFQINDEQMGQAGSVATGIIIHLVAKNFDFINGFGLACFYFTEGAKTVPANV